MSMNKRGQVSVFVIVGIVLVIIVALLFILDDQNVINIMGNDNSLSNKIENIKGELQDCAEEGVKEGMDLFGKQGGMFNPNDYRRYRNYPVPYYCTNLKDNVACYNIMPTLESMRIEFGEYMAGYMKNCINPEVLKSKDEFVINTGELDTDLDFNGDTVMVNVDYGITITKDEKVAKIGKLMIPVGDVPIAELYGVAHDIIESQAKYGYFDQNPYMVAKYGLYEINVDKPYPDVIYMVNKKGSDFQLWFAVEGEGRWIM